MYVIDGRASDIFEIDRNAFFRRLLFVLRGVPSRLQGQLSSEQRAADVVVVCMPFVIYSRDSHSENLHSFDTVAHVIISNS